MCSIYTHQLVMTEIISNDELLSTINTKVGAISDDMLLLVVPYSNLIMIADSTPKIGETVYAGIIAIMVDIAGEVLRVEAEDPEVFISVVFTMSTSGSLLVEIAPPIDFKRLC